MFFVLRSRYVFLSLFDGMMINTLPVVLCIWFNIAYSLFSIPGGILSDRFGRKVIIILGYLVYAIACIGFAVSETIILFAVFFAVYGIAFTLIDANQRALASDFVEDHLRGTALGLFHMVTSIMLLPAGIFAGLLWNIDTAFPFIYGAAGSLLATIVMFLV